MRRGFSEQFHQQLTLLPYANPLAERLGPEFWRDIPRLPGVYVMYGSTGVILYVGKAKNLRLRLASYRRAKPDHAPRKVIRLIHIVNEIHYETCATEAGALLRENELLRRHKPSYNVVNTHPESYYFIGMREQIGGVFGSSIEFRLTTHPEYRRDGWSRENFYGAFKSRNVLREAYQALLRLIWASETSSERFEYPMALNSRRVPYQFKISLNPLRDEKAARELSAQVKRYLRGTSHGILGGLALKLLEQPHLPTFYYRSIQEDLERLKDFFEFAPRRNYRMCRVLGIGDHLIPQDRVDDCIVLYKEKKKQRL